MLQEGAARNLTSWTAACCISFSSPLHPGWPLLFIFQFTLLLVRKDGFVEAAPLSSAASGGSLEAHLALPRRIDTPPIVL